MTSAPPSLAPATPRASPYNRRGVLAAHRLRRLTSALPGSWASLREEDRRSLIREIQWAVEELWSATEPSSLRVNAADPLRFLTPRERQVLDLLADGASTGELAARLGVSPNTIRGYVKSLLGKLGVHSRLEAVALLMKLQPDTVPA